MNLLTHLPILLAQADPAQTADARPGLERLSQISENLSSDGLISPHWLLISAGLVLLFLSGVSIAQWWKHRNEHSRPWMVYLTAARLAGLSWRRQWTLYWIARRQSLASPLTLMLSPATFDHHVKAYLLSCSNFRRESWRRRSQAIREHLYSDMGTPGFVPKANQSTA